MRNRVKVEVEYLQNGMVRPPQEPGHGLAIKPELIKDHQVKD